GIAAALLLGVGVVGYELGSTVGSRQLAVGSNTEIGSPQSAVVNNTEVGSRQSTVGKNAEEQNAEVGNKDGVGSQQSAVGNNTRKQNADVRKNGKQQTGKSGNTENKHQLAQGGKKKQQASSSEDNLTAGQGFVAFSGKSATKAKGANRIHTVTTGAVSKKATDDGTSKTAIQQEAEMLAAAEATKSLEEPGNLQRMEASLLAYVSENAITGIDKKEEDVLPKAKKMIFNYSLGVLANITGSTLGKQPDNPHVPARPTLFYDRPSYMVGFTHDFLFVNRVAITNSILYSRTSFDVLQPKSENYPVTLTYYTSRMTELTIPIGIKVYPVVKQNFKFYVNAGIINHIKFKETFDYSVRIDTNYTANLGNTPDQFFPVENSFDPNTKSHDVLSGVNGSPSSASTDDFSINKSKRYYASFYAGAGVEYIAKKHFVLFAEPMFYMNLQKIGVQDKRKYNFGLSGGFRYQF
ncbi:MAG TPA: outer membrane beta-barrel protein, partial [Chitinophagales bacterium]|nr:outer membrane beta-barrel protein [Chitinophagales bacterium]